MVRILLGISLLVSAAHADNLPFPGPGPGPGTDVIGTHVLYDCVDGPGYMRITAVNPYGQKNYKQIFTGSRQDCLAQAQPLRAHRALITVPQIIAVCTAYKYMMRWQIDPYANLVSLPQQYFSDRQECLGEATRLNGGSRPGPVK